MKLLAFLIFLKVSDGLECIREIEDAEKEMKCEGAFCIVQDFKLIPFREGKRPLSNK